MGQRLAVLAQLILFATAGVANADGGNKKALARELFDLAIEEYKAKQYEAASASLAKSYALDPAPGALYALAQSERLAGDCPAAIVHYQRLLEIAKDDKTARAVKENLELCRDREAGEQTFDILGLEVVVPAAAPVVEDEKAVEARDAPTIEYRTITRTERRRDGLSIALFAGGGVALGGSVILYFVARSARSDADRASTLAEYNDLYDRSTKLRWISYAGAGLGVAMIGVAAFRILGGSTESQTKQQVAVVPVQGGSLFAFSTRW